MLYFKKTAALLLSTLALSLLSVNRAFGNLPSAETVLHESFAGDEPEGHEDPAATFRANLSEESNPENRIRIWLDTFSEWHAQTGTAMSANRQFRREAEAQIAAIGEFFPEKSDWPLLHKAIDMRTDVESWEALSLIQLSTYVLERDETAALEFLKVHYPKPAVSPHEDDALQQAFSDMGPRRRNRIAPALDLALTQGGMPALQRYAFEYKLNMDRTASSRYLNNMPRLERLYNGTALKRLLGELVEIYGEQLNPYNFSADTRTLLLNEYKERDAVPNRRYSNYLDTASPTYEANIAYIRSKHPDSDNSNEPDEEKIIELLTEGKALEAWEQWESFAKASPREAVRLISRIFGWNSRNFDYNTLLEFGGHLLPYANNPELLTILSRNLPLENSQNDLILQTIRDQIAEAPKAEDRFRLQAIKLERLLAHSLVEEAEAVARNILAEPEGAQKASLDDRNHSRLVRYAKAFDLLEKNKLRDEYITLAEETAERAEGQSASSFYRTIAGYYQEQGAADQALHAAIRSIASTDQAQIRTGNTGVASQLALIVTLYAEAGQHREALTILEEAPGWRAADLMDLSVRGGDDQIQVTAAKSLAAVGQTGKAVALLHDYLRYQNNSEDAAYQALLEIDPQGAGEFFRILEKEAPYEERPLIWQAVILKQEGELEAAEKLARQAIAIDPTDGEENARDRLRAYKVLGEILVAENEQEAEVFRQIVAAVDLAEVADDYRVAGLDSMALERYRESMNLFADAYCVRFRAAVELEGMGKIEEARIHFEKAYELMPDQFGRIESHCFGCEGAFEGKRAESIAERVFSRMLEERPEQASLHYLMGYLKESQGDAEAALGYFQKAVEIDPLYYNSWQHIQSLSSRQGDSAELGATAYAAMLRIAPRRSLGSISNMELSNLAAVWEELEDILPLLPERRDEIFPLSTSAEIERDNLSNSRDRHDHLWKIKSPEQALFSNNRFQRSLIETVSRR